MGQAHASTSENGQDEAIVVGQNGANSRRGRRLRTVRKLEDDYEVEPTVLGVGATCQVRLLTSRTDGQKYAVKSFQKQGSSARAHAALRREAEIYLSLDHPHIARLLKVYETHRELHFVMEHLAGGEVYDRWTSQLRRQYTEEGARNTIHQVLLAVAYLHANDIAHRDLKLENMMYETTDGSHVKLIDFGIAEVVDQATTMSKQCGSLPFVAPEVLACSYTSKADVWSVGVIVYSLLTGNYPFHGTEEQIKSKIRRGVLCWPASFYKLSSSAQEFLQSLLVVDPCRRLSAQEALDHRWLHEQHRAQEVQPETSLIGSLQHFARTSRFRRQVLSLMAWSLSKEETSQLRQQFLDIDTTRTGTIAFSDFKAFMAQHSSLDMEEVEYLFRQMDTDNNERIEYSEFLAAGLLGKTHDDDAVLRRTYDRFDEDGDGKLDEGELRDCLGTSVTDALLEDMDLGQDRTLDFSQFYKCFHRLHTDRPHRAADAEGEQGEPEAFVWRRTTDPRCTTDIIPLAPGSRMRIHAAPIAAGQVRLPNLLSNMRESFRGTVLCKHGQTRGAMRAQALALQARGPKFM